MRRGKGVMGKIVWRVGVGVSRRWAVEVVVSQWRKRLPMRVLKGRRGGL